MLEQPKITPDNYEAIEAAYTPLLNKMVRSFYNTYQTYGVEKEDLHQEARLALYKAVVRFDDSLGVYFPTYAKTVLTNSLSCYCRQKLPHYFTKSKDDPTKFVVRHVHVASFDPYNGTEKI